VEICRMTGKRPADGCSHVEILNKEGELQVRSMVFTEYFMKGTEPTDTCELHDSNFFQRLAGVFHKPGPTSIDQIGMPANAPTAPVFPGQVTNKADRSASADASKADNKDEKKADGDDDKKKKRGFWSRFFGGKKDEDKSDADKSEDKDKDKDKKDDKARPMTPSSPPTPR
jgi:hypothetical protein